jgi:nucleotide-binding universal stress UspA family protein
MPFQTILVPLDGSPVGEAALPYAEALARRCRASLRLVRAARPADTRPAEAYLQSLTARLGGDSVNAEIRTPTGSPPEAIRAEIAASKADLVVMATHNRTGPRRWTEGSVAESVVSQGNAPVLLVRANQSPERAERLGQARPLLVVPLDGSAFAEKALSVAADIAAAIDGALVLVRVGHGSGHLAAEGDAYLGAFEQGMDTATPGLGRNVQVVVDEARAYLGGVAARFGKSLVAATQVRLGDVVGEIVQEAEERSAAAIVMTTHGRTGLARTMFGSVAGKIVHEGNFPVLLVREARLSRP